MLDFVAIDFETANKSPDSAISLAAVTVEGGRITKRAASLIRPPKMDFLPEFIDIHGIRPEEVEHKPTFDELWPAIYNDHLKGKIVIAHNAPFDIGVLRGSLTHYNLDWPSFQYACTVRIARKVWPNLYNHKLNTVGKFLGITFAHHQALDDAQTCAQIAIEAAKLKTATSLPALLEDIDVPLESFVGKETQIQTSFF